MKIKVIVGSTSKHKIEAVRDACRMLGIYAHVDGCAARSGVNEQPFGLIETRCGAYARAFGAEGHDLTADVAIGIESGIVELHDPAWRGGTHPGEYVDMAVVAVRAKSYASATISAGHAVSADDVNEARRRGFDKHTVSSVTRERTGCDATDSTPHYTGGWVTRRECLAQAVKVALAQWMAATGATSTG